jgi:hypothetical protein
VLGGLKGLGSVAALAAHSYQPSNNQSNPQKKQVQEVLEAMQEDSGVNLQMLKVDGGMTENDLLMQFQVWVDCDMFF